MKKLFALLLVLTIMASLSVTASAADNTVNYDSSKTAQTSGLTVTYAVTPTYTVTIPGSVSLDGTVTVSATNVVVANKQAVNVYISGNSENDTTFQLKTAEEAVLEYTIKPGNAEVQVGDKILSVQPTSDVTSIELSFIAPESYTYAGLYKGTVTFSIKVEGVQT